MWGYIIFCLVFLVAGILVAVFARFLVSLSYDINKEIEEHQDKIVKIPHLSDIWSPYSSRGNFFILLMRIFGVILAVSAALILYVIISNSN